MPMRTNFLSSSLEAYDSSITGAVAKPLLLDRDKDTEAIEIRFFKLDVQL